MSRKDLIKKILELSVELKEAKGLQVIMCITDMEDAVKGYEKQLCLHNVSKDNAQQYAEFCVKCDREGLPLIELEDYIKQYCN